MLSPRGRIIGLQEERVLAYDNWEAKFQSFCLPDSKEELYAQACKDATNDFARISTSIKEVEEQLKAEGTEDATGLAVWVRKLQGTEKSKLELTIGLQVERKRLAGVQESVDLISKAAGLPEVERRGVDMAVASAHARKHEHGACSCASTQASIQQELEELEEELVQRQKDTVKLMQDDLNKLVLEINEILDEIRYWGSD